MQKQTAQFVIRAIDNTNEKRPHFFSRTNDAKKRIKQIKQTLSKDTLNSTRMASFKGLQNVLDYEVYKYAYTVVFDSNTDSFVKV